MAQSADPRVNRLPHPGEDARYIEAQQVELLYTQAPAAFVATILNAGIATAVLWQHVDCRLLLGWLTLILVITLSRFVLVWQYSRTARRAERFEVWRRRFILGAGLAGIAWGSAGILLFPHDSTVHQVFLVFILGGMAAGAIATLSSDMFAFLVFFLLTLLPVTVRILVRHDSGISLAMGFLLLSFSGVMLITARQLHASIAESLRLRLSNLDLVQNLSVAKEQAEDSNQQLAASNQALSAAIMEVKANEERFRSLSAASPIGIFHTDAEGRCLYVNGRLQQITGLTLEESLGDGWSRAIHPEDRALVLDEWTRTTKERQEFSREFRLLTPQGETRWVHSRSKAILSDTGRLTGYVGTVEDINERKVVERMKDEFVSMVSHELRTPLTSMRGALGLLAGGVLGVLPEKGQRMLEIALNNTDRLVRLINDILDIERMTSGKVTMQYQACDAAALMAQAVEVMQPMAEQAGVTLSVSAHSLPLWADPDRILQTLTNLLTNAIKFSPPGSTVWLTVTRQGEEAEFHVKDQGRGIPAEKLESIFERFQQVDASDSRKEGGTGLGLAICRSIVQQHGGRIWAESMLGAGSTFFFTLPMMKETEPSSIALVPLSNTKDNTP
jgi:PAS domain S-box-containing protein